MNRLFKNIIIGILTLLLLIIISILSVLWSYSNKIPDYKFLKNYKPPVSSKVYSGNGELVADFSKEKRIFIPYNSIPKTVINIGNSKYVKADSVGLSSKTFSKEGGGLSGKSLYSNTLKTVKLISSKYDLPIIATGGVSSYDNVKELLDNGASLTGMATLLVSDPFQIPLINYRLSND